MKESVSEIEPSKLLEGRRDYEDLSSKTSQELKARLVEVETQIGFSEEHGAEAIFVNLLRNDAREIRDHLARRNGTPKQRKTKLTVEGAVQTHSIFDLTDAGNAENIVKGGYCKNLCFNRAQGWLAYDGKRYVPDPDAITRAAIRFVRDLLRYAAKESDDVRRKIKIDHARRSLNAKPIVGAVGLVETDSAVNVAPEKFDAEPLLINFQNGTYDARTNELRPHRPEDLLTKIINSDYDIEAQCSTWLKFLERVLVSYDLINFIQRAVGYSLTGLTSEQVFFILYGTGANGKSTFLNILLELFGSYGMATPVETILVKHGDHISNDVARLAGARFVSAIESEGGKRLAESLVKAMTGGDRLAARFLYHELFEFQPQFKLFLATNHRPRIKGSDAAIWRRVRLVPFSVSIPEAEQDKNLIDKLREELPGIARWAVDGLIAWREHGLGAASEVLKATELYRQESDTVGLFIAERCEADPEAGTSPADLYSAYTTWCEQAGERPMRKNDLGVALSERGFEAGRDNKSRFWKLKVTR